MSIGSRIKEARIRAGITQEQLASMINVSKGAIGNYENDTNYPKTEIVFELCRILKCDANYLYQDDVKAVSEFRVAYPEQKMLKKYRALDEHGKDVIDTLLEKEYARCKSPAPASTPAIRLISMQVFTDPAAAGIPLYAESDYERIDVPEDEVPSGADFGIRISGNSMEPTIRDGQIAWIQRCTNISDNHIGVFMLSDGTAVCKRAATGPNGRILRLLSDNPAYVPIEGDRLDGLRIVGEVLNA